MNDLLMTKSFLKYVGLKKQATKDLEISEPDLEMAQLDPSNEQNVSKFFKEVNLIKFEMEEITRLLLDLQDFNECSKISHSAKGLKEIRGRINSHMITILRKVRSIKSELEALDKSNVACISLSTKGSSAVDHTRIAVTNGLRAKVKEIMHDFQALREKLLQDHKDGLRSRCFNATGKEPSEEAVEEMILVDEQERVFQEKGDLVVENKERHEALKEVQRSLNELHRVFLDMAVLVETQVDHGINDIEADVAKQTKKRRDWGCWAGVFLLVLLVILVCILSS